MNINKEAMNVIIKSYPFVGRLYINKKEQIFLAQELAILEFRRIFSSIEIVNIEPALAKKAAGTLQHFIDDEFYLDSARDYLVRFMGECNLFAVDVKKLLLREKLFSVSLDEEDQFTYRNSDHSITVEDFIKEYFEG